jgi:glycosyltransferase involved in cell wall biosynthesis
MKKLADSKVLFVTHSLTSSPKDEWIDYLLPRCKELVYIDHPFSYKKGDIRSCISVYKKGELVSQKFYPFSKKLPEVLFYLKDIFLNFFLVLFRGRFDLCISLDPLNTSALLLYRKLRLIKKIIYYVIDYIPYRFNSKLKNEIYHLIDKVCCYNTDYIWNLSPRMQEGRGKNKVNLAKCAPDLVVPMGVDLSRIKPLADREIERKTLVYMGAFLEKQGIQLLLKVLPEVIKEAGKIKLVIIGVGEYEPEIKRLIKEYKLNEYIDFKGYIEDHVEMERELCKCAIGLAPYMIEKKSFSYYADPGKAKVYLGCGLPVVITKFPLIAYEIDRRGAGIAIDYDETELKAALIRLLNDDEFYFKARAKAITMSQDYNWNNICKKALEESQLKTGD